MHARPVGNVPLRWYKDEEHIGYDREGAKILRRQGQDRLDALLARNDAGGRALRTIYDEYNDEEIVLSREEIQLIQRIRQGRFPHVEVCTALGFCLSACVRPPACVHACSTSSV